MPELPEVQTLVDELISAGIVGKRIKNADVFWPKIIATSSPDLFCRQIKNKKIISIQRRGKYIIFVLDAGIYLAVHLRMSGRFQLGSSESPPDQHVHIFLKLNDHQHLMYHDTRKFGRFFLTNDLNTITKSLGPEPLSPKFSSKVLARKLEGCRRLIKPLLLDQTFIAGLGNIYTDEALWAAKIHPRRLAESIKWAEVRLLHKSIRYVLRQGISNAGTSLGSGLGNYSTLRKIPGRNHQYLKVYRRNGQECLECGQLIERIVVGQRGTHICSNCQR